LDPEDPASRADRLTQQNSPSVDDASDDVADKVDKEILRKLVKKHMKLMTPDEREVVNYSFWHNLDYKDIAAKMGITKERARKLESEALRKLKHPSVSDTLLGHARPLKRDTENTPWNSTPTVDSFKKEFPQLHAAARRPGQDPETAAVDFMYGHNKPLRPVREDIELLEAELAEARIEYNKKSASMEVNKDDADQRHGLYIDGKLVKTHNSREEAENVKKRDPKYKDATIKKIAEGAKVDRMVKHIAKSERSLGKSKDDAESIAWATANKRGYLDNKNKKKHVEEATIEEHFCEDCGGSLAEAGKATRALCVSSKSDAELGASQLASCKSQGLRAREGKKSHLVGKDRITVGGKKMKGKKYGGSIPDWS
jgi:hypothetical protein